MTGFSVGIGTFKALKQVLTGEVIQRIDTTADNGVTTMSLRLKKERNSANRYVVMMVGGYGNYRYLTFTNDELLQFSNAFETILESLKRSPQSIT